jgi:hypothetical protein
VRLLQDAVEQRGFAGAKKAGQDSARNQCHIGMPVKSVGPGW